MYKKKIKCTKFVQSSQSYWINLFISTELLVGYSHGHSDSMSLLNKIVNNASMA
jgi:hypothetical protein